MLKGSGRPSTYKWVVSHSNSGGSWTLSQAAQLKGQETLRALSYVELSQFLNFVLEWTRPATPGNSGSHPHTPVHRWLTLWTRGGPVLRLHPGRAGHSGHNHCPNDQLHCPPPPHLHLHPHAHLNLELADRSPCQTEAPRAPMEKGLQGRVCTQGLL